MVELKSELESRGKPSSGKKDVLSKRLAEALAEERAQPAAPEAAPAADGADADAPADTGSGTPTSQVCPRARCAVLAPPSRLLRLAAVAGCADARRCLRLAQQPKKTAEEQLLETYQKQAASQVT